MKAKVISSPENPRFKTLSKLLKTAGIRKQRKALVSGARQVKEIVRDDLQRCDALLLSEADALDADDFPEGLPRLCLAGDLFRRLDVYGTSSPILVVRTGSPDLWHEGKRARGCTLFIPFQDPANVGAVIRSAAAFGVTGIVLLREAACPFHPRSTRVAGSSLFRVPMEIGPSVHELRAGASPLIALEASGMDLRAFRFPESFGLLPGLEGPGLPEELPVRARIGIPMVEGMDSLNAALATGIALYQWRCATPSWESSSLHGGRKRKA